MGEEIDVSAVERWFVRRGVPQAIFHYNASEDVLTRMVPFLAIVWLLSTFGGIAPDESDAIPLFAFPVGLAVILLVFVTFNRIRGRRLLALPDRVGRTELAIVLLTGPFLSYVSGADRIRQGVGSLIWNLLLVGLGYLITKYGLLSMVRWGIREVGVQLRGLIRLLGRSLPLMMLFALFIFLNAEMWQVAHEFTAPYFVIVVAMVLLPAAMFLVQRSPSEIANLHHFDTWQEVDEICALTDAPLPESPDRSGSPAPDLVPLDDGERRNLASLMLTAQLVQIVLVAVVIGSFFVGFGLFTVREETILQWTELTALNFDPIARLSLFGDELVLTWELFAVSGFIAAVSALQFSVSLIGDELYREQFFTSLETEVREVLAVRARYLEPMVNQARKG